MGEGEGMRPGRYGAAVRVEVWCGEVRLAIRLRREEKSE